MRNQMMQQQMMMQQHQQKNGMWPGMQGMFPLKKDD